MQIIGFTIKKISAERKNPIKGKIEVNSDISIKDIQKESINISSKPALKFDFVFIVDYKPQIASIEVAGSVVVLDENNETKKILSEWKKKKFNHPIKVPLFNFIMNKCNLKSLLLEEELMLPLHLPLPKFAPARQNQEQGQQQQGKANYAG